MSEIPDPYQDHNTVPNPNEIYRNMKVDLREEYTSLFSSVDEATANEKDDGLDGKFFGLIKLEYQDRYPEALHAIRSYLDNKLPGLLSKERVEVAIKRIDEEIEAVEN